MAAVAAAAVVDKNARLFIATSLAELRNMVNADQGSELNPKKGFDKIRSQWETVAQTKLAEEALPLTRALAIA